MVIHQPLANSLAGSVDPVSADAFARCSVGTQLLGHLSRGSASAGDAFKG